MTSTHTLRDLGWSPFFRPGVASDELGLAEPMRVAAVHRDAIDALGERGPRRGASSPARTPATARASPSRAAPSEASGGWCGA